MAYLAVRHLSSQAAALLPPSMSWLSKLKVKQDASLQKARVALTNNDDSEAMKNFKRVRVAVSLPFVLAVYSKLPVG